MPVGMIRSAACDQRGCGLAGLTFDSKGYSLASKLLQKVGGSLSTSSILTMDLIDL